MADSFHRQLTQPQYTPDVDVDTRDAIAIYDRYQIKCIAFRYNSCLCRPWGVAFVGQGVAFVGQGVAFVGQGVAFVGQGVAIIVLCVENAIVNMYMTELLKNRVNSTLNT